MITLTQSELKAYQYAIQRGWYSAHDINAPFRARAVLRKQGATSAVEAIKAIDQYYTAKQITARWREQQKRLRGD